MMRRLGLAVLVPLIGVAFASCGSDDEAPPPAVDAGEAIDVTVPTDSPVAIDAAMEDVGVDAGPSCAVSPCMIDLVLGGTHSCALASDHSVRCWGSNLSGELGTGAIDGGVDGGFDGGQALPSPVAVAGLAMTSAIAAGGQGQSYDFSCALSVDGTATCWGSNRYGQLGFGTADGGADLAAHPMPVSVQGLTNATALTGGGAHACALLKSGEVTCWGHNGLNQLGRPGAGPANPMPGIAVLPQATPALQVATGQFHTCALLKDTTVWCWGENGKGQLGRALDGGVLQDPIGAPVTGLSGVKQISAGNFHTCALLANGLLLCWGQNDHGQIGRGTGGALVEPSPGLVALPAGLTGVQIAAGLLHTCALLSDSSVWCWGANQTGAVGPATNADGGFAPIDVRTPTKVEGLLNLGASSKAAKIAAGYLHSCALLEGGSVACWGSNQFAELGRGPTEAGAPNTDPHPQPELVQF